MKLAVVLPVAPTMFPSRLDVVASLLLSRSSLFHCQTDSSTLRSSLPFIDPSCSSAFCCHFVRLSDLVRRGCCRVVFRTHRGPPPSRLTPPTPCSTDGMAVASRPPRAHQRQAVSVSGLRRVTTTMARRRRLPRARKAQGMLVRVESGPGAEAEQQTLPSMIDPCGCVGSVYTWYQTHTRPAKTHSFSQARACRC